MAGAAGGFVTRSFEAMLRECSGKKFVALNKAIQAYIDCTKESNRKPDAQGLASASQDGVELALEPVESSMPLTTVLASAGNALEGSQAELVLQPLRLAFETKNIKLVDAALECIHKLIAYDHLEGDPGIDGGKNALLLSDILTIVCGCIDNSSPDSTILQVLKVLLTAVASTKFRVHGEPLLGVIRLCYNISISSKNPANQATSKAMLTQMISIIFRRMESDMVSLPSDISDVGCRSDNTDFSSGQVPMEDQLVERTTLDVTMNQGKEEPLISIEELQHLASGADIRGLEAVLNKAVSNENGKKISRGINLESVNNGERDALLVFRTLCKMGMKEENDDITVKTRILSLELLQGLLEGVSHPFSENFHFIDSVKAYLCYVLLRAAVSPSVTVFQYSTGIFVALLQRFRKSLKGEIGIFFPLIILRSLDSSDIVTSQRASVLRMIEKLCKDPQVLADIFVNYDCELEGPNLFERMVNSLSRIAQGSQNAELNSVAVAQASSIRTSSLQCLVNVLKSLVEWGKSQRQTLESNSIGQVFEEGTLAKQSIMVDEIKSRDHELNQFEKAKALKFTFEAAVSEFNRKPGKGIEFSVSNKLIDKTAASVAQFLKSTPGLDKAVIGEYLGQHEEFPIAVMHAYVDSMKLSGLRFDVAIREFLQGFKLPGEAQKIDRIMEKFAERYCAENPEIFSSAETAYVLAYAVIMLNTDAHNPLVSPRISKSDFVQMNSMSSGEECAQKELLEEIYDSVVRDEIQTKNDASISGESNSNRERPIREERGRLINILNLALPRRKVVSNTNIKNDRLKYMEAVFTLKGVEKGVFHVALHVELVKPMLEAVGWPLLAAFSVIMEEGDDKQHILLCMEGLKAGIHITWSLGMDTMRYAFLTSLVRFTFLHSPKQLRGKNVEALRTLLALGDTEIPSLQDSWNAVLECISRLEYLTSTPAVLATVMHGLNQISRDLVLQSLKDLAGRPIEQVFVNSVKLDSDSIVEFFTALCFVSAEELKQTPARVFSLQKLVEISYYNMARIRLVWARIWSVMANHFISAGSHHDEKIAMYAIDSLRQLGMKYLERTELTNFTFQNDILKPFVVLMRNSQNQSIRRLIVDCVVQMIKSEVGSIKSGWRSVFMIFTAAADDDLESITESAFENVEQVILDHFDQVTGDCFMDCVNCLIHFASNKTSERISLKAIALLRICEDRLAEGFIPDVALKLTDVGVDAHLDVSEHYWFPMLVGLSDLTFDSRLEVRNCALEVLFDFLNERGSKFSSDFWKNIFHRVLFPIFDQIRHAGRDGAVSSGDDCLRDTIIHSLQLLCNLFNTFYKEVSFMLPPLLNLLLDCAKKTDQSVVSISLGALVHLIKVGGHKFGDDDWDTLLQNIRDASYITQPLELLNSLELADMKDPAMLTEDIVVKRNDKTTQIDGTSSRKTNDQTPFHDGTEDPMPHLDKDESDTSADDVKGNTQKVGGSEILRKNLTFRGRIMENMMDNIVTRTFTYKSKAQTEDVPASTSPLKILDSIEHDSKEDDGETPLLETVRVKCITQLLLLSVLDCIQRKYWSRLKHHQKMAIMDILFSQLEFTASYNSFINLRKRIYQIPLERPPANLLRQEITGTTIYLDILQKSTSECNNDGTNHINNEKTDTGSNTNEIPLEEKALKDTAEEKLVIFCAQVLKDASELQNIVPDTETVDAHRVLELRAPIIVKVLRGMSLMNNHMFKKHLGKFYPLITKLICCEQMDVRGALGDLFSMQLTSLLP